MFRMMNKIGDVIVCNLPNDLPRYAGNKRSTRDLSAFFHNGPSRDDAFVADLRPAQNNGADTDEDPITDPSTMHHGLVSNGDMGSNIVRDSGVGMDDGEILNVGVFPDGDAVTISPDNAVVPDAGASTKRDVSTDNSVRCDQGIFTGHQVCVGHGIRVSQPAMVSGKRQTRES